MITSHGRLKSPNNTRSKYGFQILPLLNKAQDSVDEKDFNFPTPTYGDASAQYWKLYGQGSRIIDKNLVDTLMNNTNSMIIMNSLFSSIIASFIIEIYKTLSPASGNGQQTTDSPPSIAIRINILLFLSLLLNIVSAVSCALIQQWCSEYLTYAYPRAAPHECGRIRTYLFQGLYQFQITRFMYGTQVLLHISVVLFFWALSDFFYTVNRPFGLVTRYALVAAAMSYILASVSPFVFSNSPYNTPLTVSLRGAGIILRIIIRSPLLFAHWYRGNLEFISPTGLPYYKGVHFDRARFYLIKAEEWAEKLEHYAMEWLFTKYDFSDSDMDKFLEGLPGYLSSARTEKGHLDRYLTANYLLNRIKEHFMTCATSMELSDDASTARVFSCVKALLRIFKYSHARKKGFPDKLEELQSQQKYIQMLKDDFQALCGTDDPLIALRASCIRALAVQGLLSQLVPQDSKTTGSLPFPISIIPIYTLLFPNDNTGTLRQLDEGRAPPDEEIRMIWKSLLHDGPLTNLTILAQAIRDREHAPPSSLSFCWKALDILLTQLGTIHSGEPTHAQMDFDNLHQNIRAYIHSDERGSRVRPLLDILDIVARGRRLSMVFSGNPKYYNKADVVFGKEYLRNGGLLEAFAHCLPHFISNNSPEVCRDFMEKAIRHDDLWTSLQVNLWNTERSDSPTHDKIRIFEDCCTVLDLAFSILEDSKEVDWRAPEFGSLLQHFESFITHCFKGASMGRGTSFRVSIIKARFCNALLAQLKGDLECEGTVSFRSQWDVASFSELICTLGLQDEEDSKFWDSYIDGGYAEAVFTTKALEMIDTAMRDGPLLIFCRLGHLAASASPLRQSGLDFKDIRKVWTLQKKVITNTRLPLNHASDKVWEALNQLREKVKNLCGKYTGKDRKNLQRLLRRIEDVWNLRSSGADGPDQSELAEEEGFKTLADVNLASSSESRSVGNRFTFGSEFTAVGGEPSSGVSTSEGKDGFGQGFENMALGGEREPYVRSESPQRYDSGFHGLPSLHPSDPTVQGIPGVRIMDRPIVISPSAIRPMVPYFPMGHAHPRRTFLSSIRARTDPGSSTPRPSHAASTRAILTTRRDAPVVPLNLPISSPLGSSYSTDLSDDSQSGAETSSDSSLP